MQHQVGVLTDLFPALDSCTMRHSHKHQTLATISVNAYHPLPGATHSPPNHPGQYWKLPCPEPSNPRGHLQPLHAIDIYFWTSNDAENFINNVRRLLQYDQIELLDYPARTDQHEVSPLVQNLENIAVRDSPKPPDHLTPRAEVQTTAGQREASPLATTTQFQPLAYNPAAPAAPEPIKHREKTPPPPDAETGTGLASATYHDQHRVPLQTPLSSPPYQMGAPGLGYAPHAGSPVPSAIASTTRIPSAVGDRTGSVTSLPPPPPTSPPSQAPSSSQALVPSVTASTQQATQQYDPNGQPMVSPTTQVLGSSYVTAPHLPMQHVQPQYADYLGSTGHSTPGPAEGYSSHTYQQHQQQAHTGDNYGIHGQLYRPTEEEAKRDPRYQSIASAATPTQPVGKVDKQTAKVDKGVNRFLKKIEKKIG